MEHAKPTHKVAFKSESSIFANEVSYPKANQLHFPTRALMAILIGAFFILKPFIYIADKKRHGK